MGWDPDAFERCFRQRYPELVQFLHGLIGDRAAGEDVAQEAFARLWTRGPDGRPQADHWVFRVGRNLALDWLKTERRRNHREQASLGEPDGPPFPDENIIRVRALLHSLAPRDREVLLLREFTELSYAEIAGIVGRSENVVKQNLFRARERLRRAWQEKYGAEP
jgi:RNA polymerase sigma-70 factor, ECF subfamily